MPTVSPFMPTFEQLPTSLPVFPLNKATLLPSCELPLNIFEPRYVMMVRDALKTNQLVGMIQASDDHVKPALYNVGCVGRITGYQESSDGRLEIALTGVCRYEVAEELSTLKNYRIIAPNWQPFADDFATQASTKAQSQLLFKAALRGYFSHTKTEVDWDGLEKMEFDSLVNSLFCHLPLATQDKQILLEAPTQAERVKAFIAVLESTTSESSTQH